MKIKLDGVWACSICGSVWETDEPRGRLCGSCGADSQMEDLPFDGDCADLADPEDDEGAGAKA